ncbi:hypothetical protein [Sorangium sp. So ce1024]
MVRWWSPTAKVWRWEAHDAQDFREDAGTFRIRVKTGKRRKEVAGA